MYLTQKNKIKGLSAKEFKALQVLCRLSKNMFNVGLYETRQHYFREGKHIRYESVYHKAKSNENYKLLNTDIAQQTLKVVDRSFQSFFGLLQLKLAGEYTEKVNIPHYLPKDGYFNLIIPGKRISILDGHFNIPMSPAFKKEYGKVSIPFPRRLLGKTLKEVRIIPKYNARFFEVEFITLAEVEKHEVSQERALSLDPGLSNLVSCVDPNGTSFIVDGKYLKSINQWDNKENARLQSIKDKAGIKHFTKKQAHLALKRNNRIRDYLGKAARYIINYCLRNQIGKLIVGYNPGQKQEINLGRRNNQNFVQIPHELLRQKLNSLCERYGLQYVEQEESYTSKASFLDGDDIPDYDPNNKQDYKFSGRRIKRGLYKSKNHVINADANGAANILKKSKHNLNFERVSRGLILNRPVRINLLQRIPI